MKRKIHQRKRLLVVLIAACSLAAASLPASAQAVYNGEYYWGCTYSWGDQCTGAYQHIEEQYTMDPDWAVDIVGSGTAPANGYPKAKYDGIERDICGGVDNPVDTLVAGWACNWGLVNEDVGLWGYPVIGGAEYHGIALYGLVNYDTGV